MLTARVVFSTALWESLSIQFHATAPEEDGAFLLFRSVRGQTSLRLLMLKTVPPPAGNPWDTQGGDSLRPSAQWLSAAIGAAITEDCGLAFIHSHPDPRHPAGLSWIDRATSRDWSQILSPQLGQPFASLVWSPGGAAGVVFDEDGREVEDVRIQAAGAGHLAFLSEPHESTNDHDLDDRQKRALSELGHSRVRGLRVGVVGAGGTGSSVADQLTRIGVETIVLVDPDSIDTPSNLRRVIGATRDDLRRQELKVDVVRRHVEALDLGTAVLAVAQDVRTPDAAKALADCDCVVVTTDTHSSRAFLNQVAFQFWIPTLDVGVRIGTSLAGSVTGMPVELRTLLPDSGCLWCRGVLDSYRIRAEVLPPDERKRLAAEGYVQGVDVHEAAVAPLNALASDATVLTLMRLVVGYEVPVQVIVDLWESYIAAHDSPVNPNCVCRFWRGAGDQASLPYAISETSPEG